jgi:hypothetical protein
MKVTNNIITYIEIFMIGLIVGISIPVSIIIIYIYLYLVQNNIYIVPVIDLGYYL